MSDDRTVDLVEDDDPEPTPEPIPDPPRKGLVYCCATLGWVTPAVAFDHQWETVPPDRWD
jgi:hypothetical protein